MKPSGKEGTAVERDEAGRANADRRKLDELTVGATAAAEHDAAQARSLAERGEVLARRLGDERAVATHLHLLGRASMLEKDYERAETELRRALDEAQRIGAKSLMVRVLRDMVKCAFYTRNQDAALLRGMQALQLARDSEDRTAEALTHNDLGLVYGNLGDFEGSLEHLLAGLRLMREVGAHKLASILNNIGNVYLELGDHGEALNFFRSSLDAFRRDGSWQGTAIVLGNVGRAHSGMGAHAEALEAFEQSLAIYDEHADESYEPPGRARAATALAALGRIDEAREQFARALGILERSGHRAFEDEVLSEIGRFHLEQGELDEAICYLLRVLKLLPAHESTRRVFELHHALSDAYERNGDRAAALRHYKAFHKARQDVSDSAITVRIRGLMLQFDVERARQQEEIFRLRNVELAKANEELRQLHASLEAKNRELHQISIEDSLTGLFNRRYLDLQLGVEVGRSRRHQRPLTAAMCDIDHFKAVNDRHSHAVGDEVLRQIAGILRETARATDIVARYGGEEFVLILPDTDVSGAEILTERLRASVAQHPWDRLAQGLRITLSIGVAELEPNASASALMAAADARLYEAKRAGRDRVMA